MKKGTNEGVNNVAVTFTGIPKWSIKVDMPGLSVAFMNPSGLGPFSPRVFANYSLPTANNQSRCKHTPISENLFSV